MNHSQLNLRPDLRQESVARYIEVIKAVLVAYPMAYQVTPAPLASATFAGRLRDALRSQVDYKWPLLSPEDQSKLEAIYSDLAVSDRGHVILIASKRELKSIRFDLTHKPIKSSERWTVTNPTDDELRAICILLSTRKLPEHLIPVTVTGTFSREMLASCEAKYDIYCEDISPNSVSIA